MSRRYKQVKILAEEWEKTIPDTLNVLKDKRVRVVDGWYDAALLEAIFTETYAAGRKRLAGGLSPRLGLGCVYSLLHPLDIAVSIHDPKGVQWLMLRHEDQSAYVKWHYNNNLVVRRDYSSFAIRNFLSDNAPSHYLLTCFDGPSGWVIPVKSLRNTWAEIKAGKTVDAVRILPKHAEHPGGALSLRMDITSSPFLIKDKRQFGFK